MSTLMRWDPFREMTTLRDEMNRLFTRTIGDQPVAKAAAEATWSPPVDVFDTPEAIVLKAELPGLKVEDVDVELDENVLTSAGSAGSRRRSTMAAPTASSGRTAGSRAP